MEFYKESFISGDAHFFEDATTPAKIRQNLDSSNEVEKLKSMKLLLASMSKGRDVPEYFPEVVKNVVVKSIEVKKMVYNYLVHYADFNDACRELALLSINSFQKDLSGTNQLIRGLALRVMTSIRVGEIVQIQLLAVRKCATDASPYVRKCAANALPKIYAVDREQLDNLKQIMEGLLRDDSTMVLGSTVAAFNEICPHAYELLHPSYRKLCQLLADLDEWTQISTLEVMTRYVRRHFSDPAPGVAAAIKLQAQQRSSAAAQGNHSYIRKRRVVRKAFYSDEEDESEEEHVEEIINPEIGSVFTGGEADNEGDLDPDHRLILKSSLPLLKSRNSGVVLSVCALHYYCGTQSNQTTQKMAKALVRILRNRREMQYVVLSCISTMARERPLMFRSFLSEFFIKATDALFNKLLKLDILTSICYKENVAVILKELQTYIRDSSTDFVCAAIRAVGRVADADPSVIDQCVVGVTNMLLVFIGKSEKISSQCVVVLRQLLQQGLAQPRAPTSAGAGADATGNSKAQRETGVDVSRVENGLSPTRLRVLRQLVKLLVIEDGLESALARSSAVWLVGEFHRALADVAPDVLRILAAGFVDEHRETKMQIMNLAVKQALQLPDNDRVQALTTYVLEMARYDLDTDLRDRSRFMTAMMGLAASSEGGEGEAAVAAMAAQVDEEALAELAEHACGVMLAPKLPPVTLLGCVDVEGLPSFTVGSLSSLVGHNAAGYEPLRVWTTENLPDREQQDAAAEARAGGGRGREGDYLMGAGASGPGFGDGSSSRHARGDRGGGTDLSDFYGEKPAAARAPGNSDESESEGSSTGSESSDSESDDDNSDAGSESDATTATSQSKDSSNVDSSSNGSSTDDDLATALKGRSGRVPSAGAGIVTSPIDSVFRTVDPTPHSPHTQMNPQQQQQQAGRAAGSGVVTKQGIRKVARKKDATRGGEGGGAVAGGFGDEPLLKGIGSVSISTTHPMSSNLVGNGRDGADSLLDFPECSLPAAAVTVVPPKPTAASVSSESSLLHDPSGTSLLDDPDLTPMASSGLSQTTAGFNSTNAAAGSNEGMGSGVPLIPTRQSPHAGYSSNPPVMLSTGSTWGSSSSAESQGAFSGALVSSIPTMQQQMQHNMQMHINQQQRMQRMQGQGGQGQGGIQFMGQQPMGQQPMGQQQMGQQLVGQQQMRQQQIGAGEPEHLSAPKVILRPELGAGLGVSLVLRHGVAPATYSGANAAYLVLANTKELPVRRIKISFPTEVRRCGVQDVAELPPGRELRMPVEMVLNGLAAKQLKVDIRCDKGTFAGILSMDDWDILQPCKGMTSAEFESLRSRLQGGFSEQRKDFPLETLPASLLLSPGAPQVCETDLVLLVQRTVNVHLVQGAGLGELMFAGMARGTGGSVAGGTITGALGTDRRVLLTFLSDSSKLTVRLNCEDPVLCSGLMDAFIKLLN